MLFDTKVSSSISGVQAASFHVTLKRFIQLLVPYYDQQMHNYFAIYHTPTCFDTIVSSSGSL